MPHAWLWRKRRYNQENDRKPIRRRLNGPIDHLRLLRHCRAAERRRHECLITQMYSRPREVWRRYC